MTRVSTNYPRTPDAAKGNSPAAPVRVPAVLIDESDPASAPDRDDANTEQGFSTVVGPSPPHENAPADGVFTRRLLPQRLGAEW